MGAPSASRFNFHTALVSELGGYLLGRRLYENYAGVGDGPSSAPTSSGPRSQMFGAIPKVVFSRTLDSVQGNARLAEASLADEAAAALDATDKGVAIGGAGLAAQAIELGLVDELRMFRYPVVVGGGTPFLPPVTDDIARWTWSRPGRSARARSTSATGAPAMSRRILPAFLFSRRIGRARAL